MEDEILWESRKHFLWWPISFTKYSLSYENLFVQSGILITNYEELLLYRVVDCKCTISLGQRICGTGTVTLIGYDFSTPVLELKNIKNPLKVKNLLSRLITINRRHSNIVEMG